MADIYIGNVKGPQGDTGATGAQGPQGDAATIEVGTVSTTAYGNTAQVINTGTSSEAVFDFVIPQGRPGEETTTMSSLTLDTVTAQSAEYPIPATGESGSVVFGKIIKFFNDAKTAINSKINITDIVNNLTSTATNKPLSAAQGKALNDALTPIIVSVTSSHTNYIQCFKVGRLRILYGNVVLTSAVSAWSSAVFELLNAADRPLYTNIVIPIANASNSGEYLEIIYNTGKAQASKSFASGTQLKFAACWISQG